MHLSEIIETRDYQQRIIKKTLAAVEDNHRNILIESATGSGKTLMAHLIARELFEKYGWKSGWTSMRKHLLLQAQAENARLIKFPHITYFSTWDKNPPTDIDVYIEDEGHHSAAATSTELYKLIDPKIHLGLTATPFRTDRMKLCFSKVIKDAGIRSLIDAGWLSPFHQYIMNDPWVPESVAKCYLNSRELWGKSVVYFLTEAEAQECAHHIRQGGVRVEVVTGSSNQEDQIDSFNNGDTDVLVNMQVLTEGFDSPILKTVFVRPGSKGPTIQMAGRAFRKYPNKTHAQVVQNTRTLWPFVKIASAEHKFIQGEHGGWETREFNEKVTQAQHAAIMSIAKIDVQLPPLIRKHQKRNFYAQFGQGP